MKDIKQTLIKLAVLSVGVQDISTGAATPALDSIMKAFPNVNSSIVMMIVTIPSLCMVLFSPLYSKLVKHFKKKNILKVAVILFIIGGMAPAFLNNIYLILGCRFILGIAIGFIFPMCMDLAVTLFDGQEQKTMVGLVGTVGSLGGILFQTLGGIFASIDWHYCFLAYAVSIIFFAFALIFLPEPEIKQVNTTNNEKGTYLMPTSAWLYCIMFCVWEIFFYVMVTNTSTVVIAENLGNSASVGVALSGLTLASIISAALFSTLFKFMKKYTVTLSFILTLIGFIIFNLGSTFPVLCIGIFISGLGMGFVLPAMIVATTSLVPKESYTFAVSMISTSMGIGGFLQPIIFNFILGLANQEPGRYSFKVAAIGFIFSSILILLLNIKASPKQSNVKIESTAS